MSARFEFKGAQLRELGAARAALSRLHGGRCCECPMHVEPAAATTAFTRLNRTPAPRSSTCMPRLRMRPGCHLPPVAELLPVPDPVLRLGLSAPGGCGRCPSGSGVMPDIFRSSSMFLQPGFLQHPQRHEEHGDSRDTPECPSTHTRITTSLCLPLFMHQLSPCRMHLRRRRPATRAGGRGRGHACGCHLRTGLP